MSSRDLFCHTLLCDGCGDDFIDEEGGQVIHSDSLAELRLWAIDDGWQRRGDEDLCAACRTDDDDLASANQAERNQT